MVIDIGNILVSKFTALPWIDQYTGVVKTVTRKDEKGQSRSFPIACNESLPAQGYSAITPDNSKRSVLYLEDKGIRPTGEDADGIHLKASFDLIGWLNMKLLKYNGCSYSGIAIAGILSKIPVNPFNESVYTRISIQFMGQYQKNANPFSKYTAYDETVTQYLLHPYDYFALSFDVDFVINKNCITD